MDKVTRLLLADYTLAHYRQESPNYNKGAGLDEPDREAIIDLIVDLCHFAGRQGHDVKMMLHVAQTHWEIEK